MGIEKDLMIEWEDYAMWHPFDDDVGSGTHAVVKEVECLDQSLLRLLAGLNELVDQDEMYEEFALINHNRCEEWGTLTCQRDDCISCVESLHDSVSSLLESLEHFEADLEETQAEAVFWDMDEIARFSVAIPSKVDSLCSKLQKELCDFEDTLEAAKTRANTLTNDATTIRENIKSLGYLHVYRLLRPKETSSKGLQPKDDADESISVEDHITSGSWKSSRFISASKSLEVCWFYASKAMHERIINRNSLRVAEIMLDLSSGMVWDLSGSTQHARTKRTEHDIEEGSTADNYAKLFQEAIIDRAVDPTEIVSIISVPEDLPYAATFRAFQSIRRRRYSPLSPLVEDEAFTD